MNLGVRAHDFGKLPLEQLASGIASFGLNCIQLAPTKALAGCDGDELGTHPEYAEQVRKGLLRHGLRVSVLGCYINLGDADEASRRAQLERFKKHLRVASYYGSDIVGTETGSLNSDYSRHPDNSGEAAFQRVVSGVRELATEAEACGVNVCIEAVERYIISSPARLRRLIDEVGSPRVKVIYDPVNLLWSTNAGQQEQILDEAHSLLGPLVRVLHAKDYRLNEGRFEELSAGQGRLPYGKVFSWLKKQPGSIDVLLENTHPSTLAQTCAFIRQAHAEA